MMENVTSRENELYQQIDNFAAGGKAIIDRFVADRKALLAREVEKAQRAKQERLAMYKRTLEQVNELPDEMRTKKIREEWEIGRKGLKAEIEKGWAMCRPQESGGGGL